MTALSRFLRDAFLDRMARRSELLALEAKYAEAARIVRHGGSVHISRKPGGGGDPCTCERGTHHDQGDGLSWPQ